jgi:alpha-galactosidase
MKTSLRAVGVVALAGVACAATPSPNSNLAGTGGSSGQDAGSTGGSDGTGGARFTLAGTPPMGWNSWNRFQGNINDSLIRQTADTLVSSGMAAAGYQYLILDEGWAGGRDADGAIVPDATRFPDMKALADYVHGKGLKFGIYSDRGTTTCGGRPGSFGHETQDAQSYAAWGVDYFKYDNCNESPNSPGIEQDYSAMGNALKATGRDIVYSICAWWFYTWEPTVGNLWRTTTDIQDSWTSITSLLNRNGGDVGRYGSCTTCPMASGGMCVVCNAAQPEAAYAPPGLGSYAGPGHWNDPDMLEVGNGGMTVTEDRTHFSMWAMMAAPLLAGNDLRVMTDATRDILTNAEVIAVDQDLLGVQGQPISADTTLEVWSKRLSGTATYAVALLNRGDAPADITVTWSMLGLATDSATVRDLWAKQDLGSVTTSYTAQAIPSHGVVMLKVVGQ